MNSSSLFLSPSTSDHRQRAALAQNAASSPSSAGLMDVVPFEAALQRLLYEHIHTDEQLATYGVQQAYRGLFYAVRAATLPLKGVTSAEATLSSSSSSVALRGGMVPQTLLAADLGAGGTLSSCLVRGWQAVLYRLALAAVRSHADLECAVFLCVRLLCDRASAHGEGNERPCCTAEWTNALLHGLPLDDGTTSSLSINDPDARFRHEVQTSPRYQLGFLLLLSNTLRMVSSGLVEGQHLCCDYPELYNGVATGLLPRLAHHAEAAVRDAAGSGGGGGGAAARAVSGDGTAFPSRLAVEFAQAVLQVGHWLAMDVLAAHVDADESGPSSDAQALETAKQQTKRKRPLVLDRDQPAVLWGCVTLVRNALRRCLAWLEAEVACISGAEAFNTNSSGDSAATSLLRAVSKQLEGVVTDLLKRHEYLQNAQLNASRAYNGVATRDVHALGEMAWAHTMQMCFFLRNVTGVWVAVHGGVGYSALCSDQLLSSNRDVLMLLASCLLRVPALEGKREDERDAFLAVDATLCALVALVAAAPTQSAQSDLWAADSAVTQQVHAVLVQRGLRFHDERVLHLASLLSRAVLDAAVASGVLAGFAADSADQLLELLESDDDAASRCVGELLSVAILQHPYRLVPALFRLLQHGNATTRRNVLQVLCSLPDLLGDVSDLAAGEKESMAVAGGGEATDAVSPSSISPEVRRRRDVLRLLAENLLLQLQDEEVCVRLLSSSLFAKVHPADVLQPLLNLCVQRDPSGRKQSAALSALTSVLAAHTRTASTYVLLLHTAYRCHRELSGQPALSALPPLQRREVAEMAHPDLTADTGIVENVPLRRPVPQTPGDILSQSLLYSTGDAATEEEGEDDDATSDNRSVKPRTSVSSADASTAAKTEKKDGAVRRKEAHLHSALLSLTEKWVQAALSSWTYTHHSLPLLRCLAGAGFGPRSLDEATSTTAAAIAEVEARVQFLIKYTLRATALVTAASTSVSTRACHVLAIWTTFLADTKGQGGDNTAAASTWIDVTTAASSVVASEPPSSALAKARVHAALLPLLCLRSCAPGTFIGSVELAQTSGFSVVHEDAAQLLAGGTPEEAERAYQDIVASVWRRLWSAVTTRAEQRAFFDAYPDIQRVLLEVLCRFPAAVFFAQWERWRGAVGGGEGEKEQGCDDDNSSEGSRSTSAELLFCYRVYVFGVSAYLAASIAPASNDSAAATNLADLRVVLRYRSTLLTVHTTELPRWLMDDARGSASTGDNVRAEQEAARQRLCMAAVDAGGVLGVVCLADPLTSAHASSLPAAEVEVLRREFEEICSELLHGPLHNLTAAYRSTSEGSKGTASSPLVPEIGSVEESSASAQPQWTLLLTRFQLCLRTHASALRAIAAHPHRAKGLLLLWFRCYLRTFIEVSNAACNSATGRTVHGCRAAVDACGTVFQAVLLARKMDDAAANPPMMASAAPARAGASNATTTSPLFAPTLCRLAWEEKDALLSFSIGCTRFSASPAVQTMGVRLLSSIIVAAPEIFLELGATQDVKAVRPTAAAAAGAGGTEGDALRSAASALQSVALMHVDRPTRVLAEEVLRMLEKAYATADGAA